MGGTMDGTKRQRRGDTRQRIQDVALELFAEQGYETKREIVRRYHEALSEARPLFRFMQENQGTVKELRIGEMFRHRMMGMRDILVDPDASLADQVRCVSAVFTMHAGMFALNDLPGTDEEKNQAVLEVAWDLVAQAHAGTRTPAEAS
jgi:hypothetical protein